MGPSEFIALGGLLLGLVSGSYALIRGILNNSWENSKKLTIITLSLENNSRALSEIKESNNLALSSLKEDVAQVRDDHKTYVSKLESVEAQMLEHKYSHQRKLDNLERNSLFLWNAFKKQHPEWFKKDPP
jgi:C-terminal processing protease CtpA/Prc